MGNVDGYSIIWRKLMDDLVYYVLAAALLASAIVVWLDSHGQL
jgi:hypothetical protein